MFALEIMICMRTIFCSALGRLCLFGDHMDWCGHQVITTTINMRVFPEGKLNDKMSFKSRSFPPFSSFDEFNLNSFSVKISSDFRYVRGVIKAMKKS